MKQEIYLQVIMWLIGGGGAVITGLIIYIWNKYVSRQEAKSEKQANFNNTIIEGFATLNTTIKQHEEFHKLHFDNHRELSKEVSELKRSV